MSLRLKVNESIGTGLKRIVRNQLERSIDELANQQLDRGELIHNLRVRCKQMSAILLLLRAVNRDWCDGERRILQDASAKLGGLRDSDSVQQAFVRLCQSTNRYNDDATTSLQAVLSENQTLQISPGSTPSGQAGCLQEFEKAMRVLLEHLSAWPVGEIGFKTAMRGFIKTYRRGRAAMRGTRSERSDENLHNWRKWAKHHLYQLQVFAHSHRRRVSARCHQLSKLTTLLGDDHDLAILWRILRERSNEAEAQVLLTTLEEKRADLQKKSWKLGKRIYGEKPKQLERLVCRGWKR